MEKSTIALLVIGTIAIIFSSTLIDDQSWQNKENLLGRFPIPHSFPTIMQPKPCKKVEVVWGRVIYSYSLDNQISERGVNAC